MRSATGGWRTPLLVAGCALLLVLGGSLWARSVLEPGWGPFARAGAARAASMAPTAPAPQPLVARPPTESPPARTGMAATAVTAAEAAAHDGTELGVAVLDRVTGELAVGDRGTEPFYTASLSKLVVAVDVLDRHRLEGLPVTETDVDLIRRALGPSDDDAMNALWSGFDGAGAAGRLSKRAGLENTSAPEDPSQWGEMAMPATDMVRVWHYILDDVPEEERELLVSAMDRSPAEAADGFDQQYGLEAVPDGTSGHPDVVAKQGWMCCFGAQFYLHSAGLVGTDNRFVVALMSRMRREPGWEAARQELDSVADAAVRALR
ncbi:hypothetical protein [Pseudonocardia sp. GCM10023141]|uniref:hypothetical protein n=1 Tax=Pseudonocardia sp. GCM10023141 TaxID=3252653 RepID=UPI0036203660